MQSQIIKELKDMRYLNWSAHRQSSGTAGSFLKSQELVDGKKIYYKLSNYDAFKGIIGHECVNEIIADRLISHLGFEHLHYDLIHALILVDGREYETYLNASADFKKHGESKIALDTYYQLERNPDESPLDFCVRKGWGDDIFRMLIIDYLILNRDRHGANIEVLRSRDDGAVRLAPTFDHGLSFLCSSFDEASAERFDVMGDIPVQSFVGSRSASDNLKLVPEGFFTMPAWSDSILKEIFLDLDDALPDYLKMRISEMVCRRWAYLESFFNN